MASRRPLHIDRAREHNLKDISLDIPHDELVVITGPSGSGKSSLAFDTVYAEGQRRYVETFSTYTRQFFDKVKRPDVDLVSQVRPAVAIQQRTRVLTSRSTVGSMTNINDYLKVVWSNVSQPTCPNCGLELVRFDSRAVLAEVARHAEGEGITTVVVAAPYVVDAGGTLPNHIERLTMLGFTRFVEPKRGELRLLDEAIPECEALFPDRVILVAIDRVRGGKTPSPSVKDSIDQAFHLGGGVCALVVVGADSATEHSYRSSFQCRCDARFEIKAPRPSLFSFNHPLGACDECQGFGRVLRVDVDKVVPDSRLSINDGAIHCWSGAARSELSRLKRFCAVEGISLTTPWKDLPESQRGAVLNARSRTYLGVMPWFKKIERKIYKMHVRVFLSRYRKEMTCPSCSGSRLKREAMLFQIKGHTIADVWQMPLDELTDWVTTIRDQRLAEKRLPRELRQVFDALISRLHYLLDLGLPYITLDRQAKTLSGGETQRVNLATALGSELVSTQFVLDEPSVGLHPKDTQRLIGAIRRLADRGNSALVVEHDLDVIDAADSIIEMGPRAGEGGGEVVFNGPRSEWADDLRSVRAAPAPTPPPSSGALLINGASVRNLRDLRVEIPLNRFVVITGPSGSGKSTLVHEVVERTFEARKRGASIQETELVGGFEKISDLVIIDQSPLSKSPRATIATYSEMWDAVRDCLAGTEAAAARGFTRSHFSFNSNAGRCPVCAGAGYTREDMQFLSDVTIPCESCGGRRFQLPVLEVRYQGFNVHDLLEMSIDRAVEVFGDHTAISTRARLLQSLGCGYLRLGQPLSELSGGEAQRLKLVSHLADTPQGKPVLFVFDEPTTGLHLRDVMRLIDVFRDLVGRGHSVVVVEHNLPLIAAADWVIDLGPEGGRGGGRLVAAGTPHDLANKEAFPESATGPHLRSFFDSSRGQGKKKRRQLPGRELKEAERALTIRGAREHNLKNIDVAVPLERLVAFTGVSGSGKSTIAKDIIYAEGQRRYLDCLSPYARQFINELRRPAIDAIDNIMPTICVYQHTYLPSQLSTVGTMSEVVNYLRLLYAKVAAQYCPEHPDQEIATFSQQRVVDLIRSLPDKSVRVLAPVIKRKKGHHRPVFERARVDEISEARVDGVLAPISRFSEGLERHKAHDIDLVVARFNPRTLDRGLINDAVGLALSLGSGTVIISGDDSECVLSSARSCPVCERGFFKPDPEDLAFNSRRGACEECSGRGTDERGACCSACGGDRLGPIGRNLRIAGVSLPALVRGSSEEVLKFVTTTRFDGIQERIAMPVIAEIRSRLETLLLLGLGELPLARSCRELSNGELQRLKLSAAMGSPLSGVLYIFDEPSAGLHPNDNQKVLNNLRRLQQRGNSVIMIEHDAVSIAATDHVIDVGPGGGRRGGEIVYNGPTSDFIATASTETARSIRGEGSVRSEVRVHTPGGTLSIRRASCNNIKNLSLDLPLGSLVAIAGVSGAGKSSLVHGILHHTIADTENGEASWGSERGRITSSLPIERVVVVDQSPIGRTSRSTPASYLGIWDDIRTLYAATIEAKSKGYSQSFFSFNSGKGRCSACSGQGQIRLEMGFLAEAFVECDTCGGTRFNDDARSVVYLGLAIHDVLRLTFDEARTTYANHRRIHQALHQACELGLGYLTLGQSSATLSGGESQRLKLVSELSVRRQGHTLYLLDEPTTGLHKADVARLIRVLRELTAKGHSVVVVEHDQDLIMNADHVIEFGPASGKNGGKVVFNGLPSELSAAKSPWGEIIRSGAPRAGQEPLAPVAGL